MSEYKLIILPEAQKDIRDIVIYIGRSQRKQMADRRMEEL